MKKASLQKIEDKYINLGYRGESLRKILAKDSHYKKLIIERKQKLIKTHSATPAEKEKYVLSTDMDFDILSKCKKLEKLKLSENDKQIVALIKTQLRYDWREPIINVVNKLIRKYER